MTTIRYRRRTVRVLACAVAVTAVIGASACSSDDSASSDGHSSMDSSGGASENSTTSTSVVIPAGLDVNVVDVSFAQGMIPHHAQAVEMSQLAATNGASPAVQAIATKIEAAQQPEIDQMTGWLADWNQPAPDPNESMDEMHEMAGGMMMSGMVSSADMERLRAARGPEFDRLYVEFMILHHEGAIEMAKQQLAGGQNPDAKALAQTIIDTQQAEITELNALLSN